MLEPTDRLLPVSAEWCRSLGCDFSTLSELIEKSDDRIIEAIQKAVDLANQKAPSRAQIIQKWSILPKDFSTPGGEFGKLVICFHEKVLLLLLLIHSIT